MRLFSYVVHHDTGLAPNPENEVCTLVYCKYKGGNNILDLVEEGDWVIGTGGKDKKLSCGRNDRIIYLMHVDEKLAFRAYLRRFPGRRRPVPSHRDEHGRFALVSKTFFYFGRDAIPISQIPVAIRRLLGSKVKIQKKGPGLRYKDFDESFIGKLVTWFEKNNAVGKHGEPCAPDSDCISTITCRCRKKP